MRLCNAKGRVNNLLRFLTDLPSQAACIQRRVAPEHAGRFFAPDLPHGEGDNGAVLPVCWQIGLIIISGATCHERCFIGLTGNY